MYTTAHFCSIVVGFRFGGCIMLFGTDGIDKQSPKFGQNWMLHFNWIGSPRQYLLYSIMLVPKWARSYLQKDFHNREWHSTRREKKKTHRVFNEYRWRYNSLQGKSNTYSRGTSSTRHLRQLAYFDETCLQFLIAPEQPSNSEPFAQSRLNRSRARKILDQIKMETRHTSMLWTLSLKVVSFVPWRAVQEELEDGWRFGGLLAIGDTLYMVWCGFAVVEDSFGFVRGRHYLMGIFELRCNEEESIQTWI